MLAMDQKEKGLAPASRSLPFQSASRQARPHKRREVPREMRHAAIGFRWPSCISNRKRKYLNIEREGIRMARIPFVDVEDPSTDPKAATLLRVATEALDMELNVWKAMANHPEIMEATLNLLNVAYFNTGPGGLTLRQAELTYTTAAFTNECHY
jgi:hypothetical protein